MTQTRGPDGKQTPAVVARAVEARDSGVLRKKNVILYCERVRTWSASLGVFPIGALEVMIF